MSTEREITRLRQIEAEAKGLTAWCREFVAEVKDRNGLSMADDLSGFLDDMEGALSPLQEEVVTPAQRCSAAGSKCAYRDSVCVHCGWSV
jgi:hypothetical protein